MARATKGFPTYEFANDPLPPQPGQPIGAHPDSGLRGAMPESAAAMPTVEYDANGAFVGVSIPAPPSTPEASSADGGATTPFANG